MLVLVRQPQLPEEAPGTLPEQGGEQEEEEASCRDLAEDPRLVDLSGGAGGQPLQTLYTAPDGTTVESSAPSYPSSGPMNYFMDYLFDQSFGMTQTDYWLTQSAESSTTTRRRTRASD